MKDLFTGIDNQTLDLGRVLWMLGVITFICGQLWHTYKTWQFDGQSYGIGFGAVLAGGGFGLGAKKDTEPKPCS